MKNDVPITHQIIIPEHELEISTSRSGGPGGQHVNKTDTRITVRWNIPLTTALNDEQKARVLQNLHAHLTNNGDLIIHSSASRSQQQNKRMALMRLAHTVRKALYVPKKRLATRASKAARESRLRAKTHRGTIKKLRSIKDEQD